jgi:hypothetical protein
VDLKLLIREIKRMKKSEMYKLAQVAVINADLNVEEKLEILCMLMTDEGVAKYCESREESENGEPV